MKQYRTSFAASLTHPHPHPERTAYRSGTGMDFDVTFQVWPNRPSMAKSIRMQERRESTSLDWKAVLPLSPGEGY